MFKKTLAMLLALLMMLSLAACVINIHDGDPDDGKKQEQTTKDPDPTKTPNEPVNRRKRKILPMLNSMNSRKPRPSRKPYSIMITVL